MAGVLGRDCCLVLGLSECWAGCAEGAMGVVDAVVGAGNAVADVVDVVLHGDRATVVLNVDDEDVASCTVGAVDAVCRSVDAVDVADVVGAAEVVVDAAVWRGLPDTAAAAAASWSLVSADAPSLASLDPIGRSPL